MIEPLALSVPNTAKIIVLAGGCFWGVEAYFSSIPGIYATEVGFANGNGEPVTYADVCTKDSQYTEAVRLAYDPEQVSLLSILAGFFQIIDPTILNRQGNDIGSQYRTGIYWVDEADATTIKTFLQGMAGYYAKPIVVEAEPLQHFYRAEEEHQHYLEKHPGGYCHIHPIKLAYAKKHGLPSVPRYEVVHFSQEPYRLKDLSVLDKLPDSVYHIVRENGTEAPFSSPYNREQRPGIYVDIVTGEPLFFSKDKFDAGCGWPSFSRAIRPELIVEKEDRSHGMVRTEVRSRGGDNHLGHVFDDGPSQLGGLRYCINGAALRFVPKENMCEAGYDFLIPFVD